MAYLPKLNPTVGGGLGGLPERRATGAASANSVQRSIIGQAVKGTIAYRNIDTGDTYSLDPIEGATEIRDDSRTGVMSVVNGYGVAIGLFSDGGYVLAYANYADSGYISFEIHDADGNLIVTPTRIAAIASSSKLEIAINPLNNDFHVIYSPPANQTVYRAIYNKTGTLQGSITTLTTTGPSVSTQGNIAIDFWDDGYSAIAWAPAATTASTPYIALYDTTGALVGSTYTPVTADQTNYRVSIKCFSAINKNVAMTFSSGDTGTAATPFCVVLRTNTTGSWGEVRRFVVANDPSSGTTKFSIGYNEIDDELAVFVATAAQKLHLAVVKNIPNNASSYGVDRELYLGTARPEPFRAISLGGDRYFLTCGSYNGTDALFVGIVNSYGDWISPPKIVIEGSTYNTYVMGMSYSKATGRVAIAFNAIGNNITVKIYNVRDTTTEKVRLGGQYPVKIAEFKPYMNSLWGEFSINAQQATNKFALAWRNDQGQINWAIYSSGGTLLNGPFANTTLINTSNYQNKILLLPNGNIVLIVNTGSNTIKFGIYDLTGALQGSITTVTTTGQQFVAEVSTNGNFAIAYYNSGTASMYGAVYSQTGTLIGTPLAISNTTINQNYICLVFNPVSNNFFFTAQDTNANFIFFSVFSTLSTSVVGFQSLGGVACDVHSMCVNPDGTVTFILLGTSNLYFVKKTSVGAGSVNIINTNMKVTSTGTQWFQLLPYSNTEFLFVGIYYDSGFLYSKKLSATNGAPITTIQSSFGIPFGWLDKLFKVFFANGSNYPRLFSGGNYAINATQSLNGDQYIATYTGEVYRLSPVVTSGEYIIDGAVNTEAINATCEVIQNGSTNRITTLPRRSPFSANGSVSKKIMTSLKRIFVSA